MLCLFAAKVQWISQPGNNEREKKVAFFSPFCLFFTFVSKYEEHFLREEPKQKKGEEEEEV